MQHLAWGDPLCILPYLREHNTQHPTATPRTQIPIQGIISQQAPEARKHEPQLTCLHCHISLCSSMYHVHLHGAHTPRVGAHAPGSCSFVFYK